MSHMRSIVKIAALAFLLQTVFGSEFLAMRMEMASWFWLFM